jgi:hypothetical protein
MIGLGYGIDAQDVIASGTESGICSTSIGREKEESHAGLLQEPR